MADEIKIVMVEVLSQPYQFGDQSLLLSVIRDATSYRFSEEDLWFYQSQIEEQVDQQVHQIRRLRAAGSDLTHSNTILQEAHHRIKNNLNSVAELLTLHAGRVSDGNARIALEDTCNHVVGITCPSRAPCYTYC